MASSVKTYGVKAATPRLLVVPAAELRHGQVQAQSTLEGPAPAR